MALTAQNQNTPAVQLPEDNKTEWVGVSDFKIAKIQLCNEEGVLLTEDEVSKIPNLSPYGIVRAIMTEGEFTVESQYVSPFENSNPESKLPTLLGMLQSGEAAQALGQITSNAANSKDSSVTGKAVNMGVQAVAGLGDIGAETLGYSSLSAAIESVKGRTNLTKVNSTKVFVSTDSITIPITLFFMALKDAKKEVDDQIRMLEQWSLPTALSEESLLVTVGREKNLSGLFPSTVPPFIAMTYGGKTYVPFLIQSVSRPLVVPMDKDANTLSISVQMTIVSRQAWDAGSIKKLYGVN